MTNLYIPEAARKKHIAILGMNGSGKTSVAKAELIEPVLAAGGRVCNIDPTGVGWGLRLARDGKKKGFDIYIVGGEHADFPLDRRKGETWGEIVGTSGDSFIFDTSLMTVAARSEWFTDFAEALIRKNKGPLTFVLDEAHLFAPQSGTTGGGIAPRMLHATNNLLALGRSKGLRITMLSQRPAKLHKDSLTQAHTLIAMMLMAPHDRRAVEDWIADQADAATGKDIIKSLPTLAPGEGWLWAPREHMLDRVKFSRPTTFDSSSAPDDDTGTAIVLPSLDPETIKGKLADVAKEKAANDPAALRAEVTRLTRALSLSSASNEGAKSVVPPAALAEAEERGFKSGVASVAAEADKRIRDARCDLVGSLGERIGPILDFLKAELRTAKGEKPEISKSVAFVPAKPAAVQAQRLTGAAIPKPAVSARPKVEGTLSGPEQRIVDAIRWWNVIGVEAPSHAQVGFVAGYSHKSGTWSTYLSKLRSADMIDGRGDLMLTALGGSLANEPEVPPTGEQLRATVLAKLDGPQQRILGPILAAYPGALSHAEAGEAAGYSPTSGTWSTYLSKLRSLELIEGRGELRAQAWLFP